MKTSAVSILVVDDDRSLLKFISANLSARGYRIMTARNGAEAQELLAQELPDLIILDLVMPKVDGLDVCRHVRTHSNLPIIVLSAIDDEDRKVQALDMGADDYLTKPFGLQELLARVRAVLRRAAHDGELPRTETPLVCGNLTIDRASRRVTVGGEELHLTRTEFALLYELMNNRDRVLTQDMLLSRVWGVEYRGSSQYLHIYVSRLRQKLADTDAFEIVTEPGIGYQSTCRVNRSHD